MHCQCSLTGSKAELKACESGVFFLCTTTLKPCALRPVQWLLNDDGLCALCSSLVIKAMGWYAPAGHEEV